MVGIAVVNLLALEDGSTWQPRTGQLVQLTEGEPCGPGWTYQPDQEPRFTAPEPPAQPDEEGPDDGA